MTGHCIFVSLAPPFQKETLKSQQIVNSLGMETCKWWKLAEVIPKYCVCTVLEAECGALSNGRLALCHAPFSTFLGTAPLKI